MADLLAEGGDSNGNGTPTSRPQIPAPAPTNSPRSNIRGPRMIMQERQEREARRAERERLEREQAERVQAERAQAEQDARVLAEQRRQAAERERGRERAAAAAAAAATTAAASAASVDPTAARLPQESPPVNQPKSRYAEAERRQRRTENAPFPSSSQQGLRPSTQQQAAPQPPALLQPQHMQQPQQRPGRTAPAEPGIRMSNERSRVASAGIPPAAMAGGAAARPADLGPSEPTRLGADLGGGSGGNRPRNSFPHAFERWEALSAHWEGLTSFWIRQLQQRADEIDRDPLSRQLARQVTDLSAAGANLFHAVVELQRLRASSERKFQRWFHDMRGEMERSNEVHAMLEAAIQEERRSRDEAIREALENERTNSKAQKKLEEMRKELAISKDEARRAWEELGRREQEERDRVIALQEGQPTIVGGVQVVPMMQGLPVRQRAGSTGQEQMQQQHQQPPPPQQQPLPQQQMQQQMQPPPLSAAEQTQLVAQQQYQQQYQPSPYSQVSPGAAGPSGAGGELYQQPQGHSFEGGVGQGSDETYEGEFVSIHLRPWMRDDILTALGGAEEENQYGTPTSLSAPGSTYPPSASQQYYSAPPQPGYGGQAYAAPGWETIPRHQHPTRLSDVIEEEDERSRTSASQVSRGDR